METNIERAAQQMREQVDNTPIYSKGLRARLEQLLENCDIDNAKKMFSCHREEAQKAISQFDVEKHDICSREDKHLEGVDDYRVGKLTRAIQQTTNNVGTFFMFGNPLKITLSNEKAESESLQKYFKIYTKFLKSINFDERMFEARQIAGAESECAKLFVHYTVEDEDELRIKCINLKNSDGYTLYQLFNQYGDMVAFAYEKSYRTEDGKGLEDHFVVYTKKKIWEFCKNTIFTTGTNTTWRLLSKKDNPFGKIPVIYYHHDVDWEGAQRLIDQLEWVISKFSDTVEYCGDPMLVVTPDIADGENLAGAREVGKAIVCEGEGSKAEFLEPPACGDYVSNEIKLLVSAINQDTMTPDWSYENIMGLGTLSGEAMRRVNLSGYVKRTKFSVKTYSEMIRRELNLIQTILCKCVYIDNTEVADGISRLELEYQYVDPFIGGIEDNSTEIATLMGAGMMSIHSAIAANRNVDDKYAEEERVWDDIKRKAEIEAAASEAAKPVVEQPVDNE